jgi:hypothetical protein
VWLRQAQAATSALAGPDIPDGERAFLEGKLAACRYFRAYELGRIDHWIGIFSTMDPLTVVTPSDRL